MMFMLEPIHLENDQLIVHGFRPEDLARYETLVKEVYQLFSDADTLQFIPEKRLASLQEADNWLKRTIQTHYRLTHYPHFIEFYLRGSARGQKIMSSLLPELLNALKKRGIYEIAAAIHVQNSAARKVLTYSGFRFAQSFDARQEFYHYRPQSVNQSVKSLSELQR